MRLELAGAAVVERTGHMIFHNAIAILKRNIAQRKMIQRKMTTINSADALISCHPFAPCTKQPRVERRARGILSIHHVAMGSVKISD